MTKPDDVIADLVAACIERSEVEGEAAVRAVCSEHPEHAEAIRRRLRRLGDMGLLGEPDTATQPLPDRIGGYTLVRRLGAGGMGVVHLARQERPAREVALKLIRPEQLWFPGARERFAREAELIATLSHPAILPLYEVGEERGVPWLSMEFVEGATLEDITRELSERDPAILTGEDLREAVLAVAARLRDTQPSESPAPCASANTDHPDLFEGSWCEAVFAIGHAVAEALSHAHGAGVLHRDIKPSNVVVGVDGRVRLLDFGLAVRDGSARLTATGQLLGSLAYMSPERLSGDGSDRDPRGDIYSLGATLFELLTLRTPFVAESLDSLRRLILDTRAPSPGRFNSAVSRDACAVCLVALDPDPDRRYVSAADLASDLKRLLDRTPVLARPPSFARRAITWAQRQPVTAAALAASVLLTLGGSSGYALLKSGHADDLSESLEVATSERVEAEAQRTRAEDNLDFAQEAVDTLLADLDDKNFAGLPGMEELRRRMRVSALGFYEELLGQDPTSPRLLINQLHLRTRIAQIHHTLDERHKAIALWSDASDEARALIEAKTGEWTDEQLEELHSLALVGRYNATDGDALLSGDAETIESVREQVEAMRKRALSSMDESAHVQLAEALGGLGSGLVNAGDLKAARKAYDEALDVLTSLEQTSLEPITPLHHKMALLYRFSALARHAELPADMRAAMLIDIVKEGVAIQTRLAQLFETEDALPFEQLTDRARLFGAMAFALGALGEPDEAERFYRAAIRDGETVVAAAPMQCQPLVQLASDTHEYANFVIARGRREDAKDVLRQIAPQLEASSERCSEVGEVKAFADLVAARLTVWLAGDLEFDEAWIVTAGLRNRIITTPDWVDVEHAGFVGKSMAIYCLMAPEYKEYEQGKEIAEVLIAAAPEHPLYLSSAASTLLRCATESPSALDEERALGIARALDVLERAVEFGHRIPPVGATGDEPWWDAISDNPRMAQLRQRMTPAQ